jgi:hypothetical protein
LPTEIQPLHDFSVTSTAFTAKKVGALQEAEVWTLDKLLANGFELFKWDGMYVFFLKGGLMMLEL